MKLSEKKARELGIPIPPRPAAPGRKRKGKGDQTAAQSEKARQALFYAMCEAHGLPEPIAEYRFNPERQFRFDWLFDGWLAVEVNGGNWIEGRHTRAAALALEYSKLNSAVILGYSVLLFVPEDIDNGSAFPIIRKALDSIGGLG